MKSGQILMWGQMLMKLYLNYCPTCPFNDAASLGNTEAMGALSGAARSRRRRSDNRPTHDVKTELNSEVEFRSSGVSEDEVDSKRETTSDQNGEEEDNSNIGMHSVPSKSSGCLQSDSEKKHSPVCLNTSASYRETTETLLKQAYLKHYWESGICSKSHTEKNFGVSDSPIIVDVGATCIKKKYQCTLCDKGFGKKSTLKLHLRIHWGENSFKCTVCGKDFSCNGNLIRHLRIHTGEKPYRCTLCGKEFTQSSILTKHTRVHFRERPYKCTSCGKHFSQKYHLTIHVRTHSKERPFRCVPCGIGFSQRSHLTKHLLVHAGKRPYICTVCSEGFSERSHLAIHARTHSTEEPYNCALCGKSFTKKCSLIRHLIIHTGERPFYCTLCGKSFTQSAHLKGHQRKLCNVSLQGD